MESVSHRLHPAPRPPHPFSTAIALYAFSLLTCIVLSAEVKALDILILLFKQAPLPRVCFRNTIKYIFLLFSFFQFFCWLQLDGLWQLCWTSRRGSWLFCFFLLLSLFFPDVTLALMLNPPPTQPLSPPPTFIPPFSFYPGGGGSRHCTETGHI